MSRTSIQYLGLDIGTVRTGVAVADSGVKIAVPLETIEMNKVDFATKVAELVRFHGVTVLVVGYPRNQSGEPTKQTAFVESKVAELNIPSVTIVFQDESLTSVIAHERLGAATNKGKIDAEAAAILLQDYLELHT